jgi:hypothetical protein
MGGGGGGGHAGAGETIRDDGDGEDGRGARETSIRKWTMDAIIASAQYIEWHYSEIRVRSSSGLREANRRPNTANCEKYARTTAPSGWGDLWALPLARRPSSNFARVVFHRGSPSTFPPTPKNNNNDDVHTVSLDN